MALTTYLFLTYLIPLLYGQPDATSNTSSKLFLIATPISSRVITFSASDQVNSEILLSWTGQSTTLLKPSQNIFNTMSNERSNFTTAGILPKLSSKPSVTPVGSMMSSMVSSMVQPSVTTDSSQILITTTTSKTTSSLINQTTSSISKPVTAPTNSRLSISLQSPSTKILVPASPVLETRSSNNSSQLNVVPSPTISTNGQPIPTALKPSKLNITTNGMSQSFNAISLSVSFSPLISTSIPVNLSSSHYILNPTTSMKFNQVTSTTVVPSLSSSDVKLNLTSGSSSMFLHESSVTLTTNITSSPTMNPASVSMVLPVTSSSFKLNSISFSFVSSVPVTSEKLTSMLHPTSTVLFIHSSVDVSSTVAIEASCNVLTCVTLEPSSTIIEMSIRTILLSSPTKGRSTSTFVNHMSMSSSSVVSTASVGHYKPTKGTEDKEESHTTLIIGLAVGLSLAVIVIIVVIVWYRRRRSSYQYNVFYDEQNIVMHPFDYSK